MGDWRDIRVWTRDEMMKRVARFKDLKGSDGGLPDSDALHHLVPRPYAKISPIAHDPVLLA